MVPKDRSSAPKPPKAGPDGPQGPLVGTQASVQQPQEEIACRGSAAGRAELIESTEALASPNNM